MIDDNVKAFKEAAIEGGALIVAELVGESLLGQVLPGVISGITAYRQKRFERNVNIILNTMLENITEIQNHLNNYQDINFVKDFLLPVLFDNAMEEIEEEKIQYIVRGFETALRKNLRDQDIILMYYDILKQLRVRDLDILLNLYHRGPIDDKILDNLNPGIQSLYRVNHIKSFGLLKVADPFAFGGFVDDEYMGVREGDLNLSGLGYAFINFFVAIGKITDMQNE